MAPNKHDILVFLLRFAHAHPSAYQKIEANLQSLSMAIINTGLTTKDYTLQIVQNVNCLFPYIHALPCNCKLVSFFSKSLNKPLLDYV